jgi:predicted amidohydrolase
VIQRQMSAFTQACFAPQLALAEQAVQAGTNLILFREDCNGAGNLTLPRVDRPDLLEMAAETIPGPTSEGAAALARKGNCYVVICLLEKLDGKIYNTAALLDPHGSVIGKYFKTHLPPLERFLLTPGSSLPVFQTEIGSIGMLICYDMMTPEVTRCLALKGADILCWPSLGYGWWDESGDFTIQSRAHDNQVYLLGALPVFSHIVSPYGDRLVNAGLEDRAVIQAQITPGADPIQDPEHTNSYVTETNSLRERHLFERRPELYTAITDPAPELMKRYPDTHMYDQERDPAATFRRYHAAKNRLHWQTRKDRVTH